MSKTHLLWKTKEFITHVLPLEYSAVEFLHSYLIFLEGISLDFLPECPSLIKACFFLSLLVIIGLKCYVLLTYVHLHPRPQSITLLRCGDQIQVGLSFTYEH